MKIVCPCGDNVVDNSDSMPYKAYLIADQDEEDMVTNFGDENEKNWEIFSHYSKPIYQCETCARLLIQQGQQVLTFCPDKPKDSARILRSVEGENWKRHLRGNWRNGKGEVYWGFGVEDEGFEADFKTWEELESKYFEVLNRLESKLLLRDSFLKKDGQFIHQWPQK
ncbi:hypothetical protein BVY03_03210 [bacterium K02(2017)]|nr:hypothetical protein BVY03_03210 [bacterium K02(2017)]